MTVIARLTSDIVSAFVENNAVSRAELVSLIGSVGAAVETLDQVIEAAEEPSTIKTKAQIKASIRPDHLVSFEDGRSYKSLKRHLGGCGLTPAEYREKYGLPSDYPMVSPSYSAARSELAKAAGLGNSRRRKAEAEPAAAAAAPKKRARPTKAASAATA